MEPRYPHKKTKKQRYDSPVRNGDSAQFDSLPVVTVRIVIAVLMVICISRGIFGSGAFTVIFAVAAIVFAGWQVLISACTSAMSGRIFTVHLMVLISAACAVFVKQYTAAVVLISIAETGILLKNTLLLGRCPGIRNLSNSRPRKVTVLYNGEERVVPVTEVKAGDLFVVLPGDVLPLDGVVVAGESNIDMLILTGENEQYKVGVGKKVLSGGRNLTDRITVKASGGVEDAVVTRVLRFAEKSDTAASDRGLYSDRFVSVFAPCILVSAVIIAFAIPLILGEAVSDHLKKAVTLIAVMSPSAFLLFEPLSCYFGIGAAAGRGILFRDSSAIEDLADTTSVVFDETGTLTSGEFEIASAMPNGIRERELLMLASYAGSCSSHPLAKAVAGSSGVEVSRSFIAAFTEKRGRGTSVKLKNGNVISVGNLDYMNDLGIDTLDDLGGDNTIFVAAGRRYAGCIRLSDRIKPDSENAVMELYSLGIDRVAMITGDAKESAERTSEQIGIKELYADCSPGEKLSKLRDLLDMQLDGDMLAYVGDGVLNSDMLKTADIGITVGGIGSDDAADAASVVILSDKIVKVPEAVLIAEQTCTLISQNMYIFLFMKAAFIILAILGIVSSAAAVIADIGTCVLAAANAVRIFGIGAFAIGGRTADFIDEGLNKLDDEFYYGDDDLVDESIRRTVEEEYEDRD